MNNFTQIRQISYKNIRTWYAGLVKPKKNDPPYRHIIQVGDPNLRTTSDTIPVKEIQSPEIKFLIKRMKYVFDKYSCIGLSATQIGVPLRLFMIEFNKKHAKSYTTNEYKHKEMSLCQFTVVINPEIKILDHTKLTFPESCESIKGFWADVPRHKSIQLKGMDAEGEPLTITANGWLARLIQHEMDHLNGKIYTDIMDKKTFTCSCWQVINERGGRVELPYGPV